MRADCHLSTHKTNTVFPSDKDSWLQLHWKQSFILHEYCIILDSSCVYDCFFVAELNKRDELTTYQRSMWFSVSLSRESSCNIGACREWVLKLIITFQKPQKHQCNMWPSTEWQAQKRKWFTISSRNEKLKNAWQQILSMTHLFYVLHVISYATNLNWI